LEPLAVENGDEHSECSADLNVHDFPSAVKHDHDYLSSNCSMRTPMLLSLIDLDKQDQEIKHLIANLEDKENLRRELFIHQATMDDSAVRFYTGIPSLTYLMASYSILKPAAEK